MNNNNKVKPQKAHRGHIQVKLMAVLIPVIIVAIGTILVVVQMETSSMLRSESE